MYPNCFFEVTILICVYSRSNYLFCSVIFYRSDLVFLGFLTFLWFFPESLYHFSRLWIVISGLVLLSLLPLTTLLSIVQCQSSTRYLFVFVLFMKFSMSIRVVLYWRFWVTFLFYNSRRYPDCLLKSCLRCLWLL